MNNVIWTKVRKMEKDGEITYFAGAFRNLIKEITEGNRLKGVAFKNGQVGFMMTKDPTFDAQELLETPVQDETSVTEETSVRKIDISELNKKSLAETLLAETLAEVDPDMEMVEFSVKVPAISDKVVQQIAEMVGEDIDEVRTKVYLMGSAQLGLHAAKVISGGEEEVEKGWKDFQKRVGRNFGDTSISDSLNQAPDEMFGFSKLKKKPKESSTTMDAAEVLKDPNLPDEVREAIENLMKNKNVSDIKVQKIVTNKIVTNKKPATHEGVLAALKRRLGFKD